jgi:hypothetical protein
MKAGLGSNGSLVWTLLGLLPFRLESGNYSSPQTPIRYAKKTISIELKVVGVDNELTTQKPDVRNHLENTEFMKVEPSAPYTQGQNGGAERLRGVLKDETCTMAIGARRCTGLQKTRQNSKTQSSFI